MFVFKRMLNIYRIVTAYVCNVYIDRILSKIHNQRNICEYVIENVTIHV